jgi:ribosomal protein S18 acetylase RimI-like enzyme
MLKQAILAVTVLCNVHAADGAEKNLLDSLTNKVEQIDLGDARSNHYKVSCKTKVTYFYKDTQVGFIYYGASSKQEKYAQIDSMLVETEFRSQGIGCYMLRQTMLTLKNEGYNQVRLKVMPLLATDYKAALVRLIPFYQKHGFSLLKVNDIQAVMQASI